jgi:hypothetical protein
MKGFVYLISRSYICLLIYKNNDMKHDKNSNGIYGSYDIDGRVLRDETKNSTDWEWNGRGSVLG